MKRTTLSKNLLLMCSLAFASAQALAEDEGVIRSDVSALNSFSLAPIAEHEDFLMRVSGTSNKGSSFKAYTEEMREWPFSKLRKEYWAAMCISRIGMNFDDFDFARLQALSGLFLTGTSPLFINGKQFEEYDALVPKENKKDNFLVKQAFIFAQALKRYPLPKCAFSEDSFRILFYNFDILIKDPDRYPLLEKVWPEDSSPPTVAQYETAMQGFIDTLRGYAEEGESLSAEEFAKAMYKNNILGQTSPLPGSMALAEKIMKDAGINPENTDLKKAIAIDISLNVKIARRFQKYKGQKEIEKRWVPASFNVNSSQVVISL